VSIDGVGPKQVLVAGWAIAIPGGGPAPSSTDLIGDGIAIIATLVIIGFAARIQAP
jgi:hypothetical protein